MDCKVKQSKDQSLLNSADSTKLNKLQPHVGLRHFADHLNQSGPTNDSFYANVASGFTGFCHNNNETVLRAESEEEESDYD